MCGRKFSKVGINFIFSLSIDLTLHELMSERVGTSLVAEFLGRHSTCRLSSRNS